MIATTRRLAVLHAMAAAIFGNSPPADAIPPPNGSIKLLLPLVQQRLLLAECSAAVARPLVSWSSLRGIFYAPPLTDPAASRRDADIVGNLVRAAAFQYEASLVYQQTLSADDRKQCFPRRDEECVRLQTDSDLLMHELLINNALSAIQAVEAELSYLSLCERGSPRPGQTCLVTDDRTEIVACLRAAEAALDRYFDVVPADDARAAVGIVAKDPRWDLVPLSDDAAAPADGGPVKEGVAPPE